MKKDVAVKIRDISKVYKLYDQPIDRLKEALHPFKKKYHKDFYALKDINLEIKKGEVLGIVGVNGAGKSTLLKILAGVLTPSSGRVNVSGDLNAILELGSGLKPEMTGRENIRLNLQINGHAKSGEQLVEEIVAFAELGEHIDQPVKTYSSGMKARLGFGIATSTNPDVLIVDEVLAVGDILFKRKCFAKIEELFKSGKTVIFVSHSSQSVIEFCDRAILLYDREIIMDDTPKKVTDFYQKLVFSKDKKKTVADERGSQKNVDKKTSSQIVKSSDRVKEIPFPDSYIKGLCISPIDINPEYFKFLKTAIYSSDDRLVNDLCGGKRYTVSFIARAQSHVNNVSFGVQIKTLQGVIVSGCNMRSYDQITEKTVKIDDEFKVVMEFDNLLLPSTYILSVFADDDEERVSIQNDSYIFKVKADSRKQGGYVRLNQKITWERLNNE